MSATQTDRLRHERDLLGEAIVQCGIAAGVVDGSVSLTGPELLLVADDVTSVIERLRHGLLAVQATANDPDQPGETQRLADVDQLVDAIFAGTWQPIATNGG